MQQAFRRKGLDGPCSSLGIKGGDWQLCGDCFDCFWDSHSSIRWVLALESMHRSGKGICEAVVRLLEIGVGHVLILSLWDLAKSRSFHFVEKFENGKL